MLEINRLYQFLKTRHDQCVNKLSLVNVLQIGGGRENYCLSNAEDTARALGHEVISGWLSLPSKIQGNDWQKQFTQHWWNYDTTDQKYLDYSPNIEEGAIYIRDDEITKFISENIQHLDSHVASSIILKNDKFYAVDYWEKGFRFHELEKLSMQLIFFFQTLKLNS
jgi:hypothetical protein